MEQLAGSHGGGGGLSKNIGHHSYRRRKILKYHWLKRPKTVTKNKILEQKINDSKPHIWIFHLDFSFQIFYQKVSKPTKTSKKNPNSLNIVKNMLLRHSQKL